MIRGEYVFVNNRLLKPEAISTGADNTTIIYEVLRITNGVPLFFEEHYHRFMHSFQISGKRCELNSGDLKTQIQKLVKINEYSSGNVMIRYLITDNIVETQLYFIPHHYPNKIDYERGVQVGLFHAERMNPAAKVVQQEIRSRSNSLIETNNWYEVLLVDRDGRITEGSKSNVFFIKNDVVYTSPLKHVLTGITLKRVVHLCELNGISLKFEPIQLDGLHEYDAVFLTGTSPKVLPVSKVDNITFNPSNETLKEIMKLYNQEIEIYLNKNGS